MSDEPSYTDPSSFDLDDADLILIPPDKTINEDQDFNLLSAEGVGQTLGLYYSVYFQSFLIMIVAIVISSMIFGFDSLSVYGREYFYSAIFTQLTLVLAYIGLSYYHGGRAGIRLNPGSGFPYQWKRISYYAIGAMGIWQLLSVIFNYAEGIFVPEASIPPPVSMQEAGIEPSDAVISSQDIRVIIISFALILILQVVSNEYIYRGLLAGEMRRRGTGAFTFLWVPAIVYAVTATETANLLEGYVSYYLFNLIRNLVQGLILTYLFWKVKHLPVNIAVAVFLHLFRGDVRDIFIEVLPLYFGKYDPEDSIQTWSDRIILIIDYLGLTLAVMGIFILVLGYKDVGEYLGVIRREGRKQAKPTLIVAAVFFGIQLIFGILGMLGPSGFMLLILGWIFAAYYVNSLISRTLKSDAAMGQLSASNREYLLQVPDLLAQNSIKFLKKLAKPPRGKYFWIFFANFFFVIFSFITYSPRQISNWWEPLYLILLPVIALSFCGWAYARYLSRRDYFLSSLDTWIRRLIPVVLIFYAILFTNWMIYVEFHLRIIILTLPFVRLWVPYYEEVEIEAAVKLLNTPRHYSILNKLVDIEKTEPDILSSFFSRNLTSYETSGFVLLVGALDLKKHKELVHEIMVNTQEGVVQQAAIITMGIIGERTHMDEITSFLRSPSLDLRAASAWALGLLNERDSLKDLSSALEVEPDRKCQNTMIDAILKIDPTYPVVIPSKKEEITFI
ncbi:MAG: HEAT repeat domain-containing protein [Candidatus Heimdallarchaeota archaeon]|nr:HEAT repeat domain-containing protein [Candidatus Heimdallarchaeota archaeon]MCK5048458.1 HEAT repeat domain-containing protein [Candidatus Heimdallarchaeota archaeon]